MGVDGVVVSVVAAAGFIAAVGAIWKVARFIFRVDRALPTLLNIAAQFENNGGSTIKDKLDRMEHNQETLGALLASKSRELESADRITLKIAEDTRTLAETTGKIIDELIKTQVDDVTHIKQYMHESMHGIRNEMQKNLYAQMASDQRAARIEHQLDMMLPLVARHRKDDPPRETRLPD